MVELIDNVPKLVIDCSPQSHISSHFKVSEFLQTSKGERYLNENYKLFCFGHYKNAVRLSLVLEAVRRSLGDTPVVLNSGFRSPLLNARVGGAARSYHLTGCAADLAIAPTPFLRKYFDTLKEFNILSEVIYYTNFIHIAIRDL